MTTENNIFYKEAKTTTDPQYFKHYFSSYKNVHLLNLRMKKGLEGLGIYWILIEKLYQNNGRIHLNDLKVLAHYLQTDLELLTSVVFDFDLFEHDEEFFWSNEVVRQRQEICDASGHKKELSLKRKKAANKK